LRARAVLDKLVRQQPAHAEALCILGVVDAALDKKEEAIREGRRALELLPPEKDAISGEIVLENLTLIYIWTGERELALTHLATASRLPGGLNYGYLRLHPYWDALRGDSRFEEIVASLASNAR
jgi:serine/threonine-protein kinase